MKTRHKRLALIVAISSLFIAHAHAGRSCEATKPSMQAIERRLTLAAQALAALEASGHKVVILARAGQDLSKYGVRYSHLGIAYKEPHATGGNVWRVLHKLNHCGTSSSAIYRHGLGEFFLDDLRRYEAAYVPLAADLHDRLLILLQDNRSAVVMHHPPYSIASYAWGQKYQQSNQCAIETLAYAAEPDTASRPQAQAWLKWKGYQPAALRLGPLTRLGGRISSANVAFDDHPSEKRFSDRIETVTVDSVFDWLERTSLGQRRVAVQVN